MSAALAKVCLLSLCIVACCGVIISPVSRPAWAGQSLSDLEKVSAQPAPGDRLPLGAVFLDENGKSETLAEALDGRPAIFLFVDYACNNMCGAMLLMASRALTESALDPGADYRFLALGLDPSLGPSAARQLKEDLIAQDAPLFAATQFLTGSAAAITAAATAVGYRYSPDVEHRQFAHAAALLVVSGDGRVTRLIRATDVTSATLSRALVEARQASSTPAFEPVRLLCYGFSPSHGLYNGGVWAALQAGGAFVLALVAAGVIFLLRRSAA